MNTNNSSANAVFDPGVAPPNLLTCQHGYFVAGTGTPVVMLHASLSSKSQWTALAERLASRFRVIAIDLCGYGDNAVPTAHSRFTLDEEVRIVNARLDELVKGRVRVHVVGHAYGGLVALRFAQCNGDRVASLSLYEPVVFRMLDTEDPALVDVRQIAKRVFRFVAEGRYHDAAQTFVDFWGGDGSYGSLSLSVQVSIARRVDKLPLDFLAASCWPPRREDLRAIVAPTLLLAGNRSPAVARRIHALLTRALPNRRVGWFDAGHMGPITDAPIVNPWIEAFVDICTKRDAAFAASRADISPASRAFAAD